MHICNVENACLICGWSEEYTEFLEHANYLQPKNDETLPRQNHPQRCVQCWQNPGWSPIFEAIGNCESWKETYLTHPAPKHTHTDDPLAVWQFGICIAQAPLPSCSCILLRVLLGDG